MRTARKMLRPSLSLVVVVAAIATMAGTARAEDLKWEYERLMAVDYVAASVVGMPYHGTWSVRPRGADPSSPTGRLDNADAGTFLGAGWGVQLVTDVPHGMRLSFLALYHRGTLVDQHLPFTVTSPVDYGEAGVGFGWQHQWGRLSFHTTTVLALDSTGFDVAATGTGGGLVQGLNGTGSTIAGSYHLSRFDLRVGQQVGLHVVLTRWLLGYLDAQIDIDGEWHVRAGLGIGGIGGWDTASTGGARPWLHGQSRW